MYEDIVRDGDSCRLAYKNGIDAYVKRLQDEGNKNRESFLNVNDFSEKIEEYRQGYIEMLGINKISEGILPTPTLTRVGEDGDAVIYRVTVHITEEIPMYGLLFVPHGTERAPLVIVQHGGGGTPELCSDMNGDNNYNHIVRRVLKRGAVVFAPQLLLWNYKNKIPHQPIRPIEYDRVRADRGMKRFGVSITAIEIRGIMNAISFLSELEFIDENSIAMTGISYGGYFTLYTMAADTRIRAGYSNACFNDRNAYPWQDWSYPNSGNTFHDAEVAALCAPRRLYVAVGKNDEVFDYKTAVPEAERVCKYFDVFGCPENFVFSLWDGGHTVSSSEDGFDFVFESFENRQSKEGDKKCTI